MTEKKKSTAPVSSVGADGEQPNVKSINEIIANENVKNNLQATKSRVVSRNITNRADLENRGLSASAM